MNHPVRIGRLAAASLLLLAGACTSALAVTPAPMQVDVPALTGRIVDLTGTLSAATVTRVQEELAALEASKGSQVAVLIVPTTQPEEIEQFGIRVAERWHVGRKGIDDGAILIVAKNDRRVRIEVGYGLEGALPDATANRIIDEDITPRFRQGDFDGGVRAGVERMLSVIGGESLPPPATAHQRGPAIGQLLPLLLVVVFVVSGVLRALLGPLFGSIATGGIIGAIAFFISKVLFIGIGAGIVAWLFALLGGSRGGWSSGGGLGGFGGFGGGGLGGGGGFSGGGGGFGGGGASGRW